MAAAAESYSTATALQHKMVGNPLLDKLCCHYSFVFDVINVDIDYISCLFKDREVCRMLLMVELDMELVEAQAARLLLIVCLLVATAPTASCTSSGINSVKKYGPV